MVRYIMFALALLAVPAYGQIDVKEKYGQYEPIEIRLADMGPNAQVIWDIFPRSGQQHYTSRDFRDDTGPLRAVWGEPGEYEVQAIVFIVNFETKTSDLKRFQDRFTIEGLQPGPVPPPGPGPVPPPGPGPVPPPVPPPGPSVPPDAFSNVGQGIDGLADAASLQYDIRVKVSDIYADVATKLDQRNILQIRDAAAEIERREKGLNLSAAWAEVHAYVVKNGTSFGPMDREQAIAWYRAVAAGYKGGPL